VAQAAHTVALLFDDFAVLDDGDGDAGDVEFFAGLFDNSVEVILGEGWDGESEKADMDGEAHD
jgi:hypothetical protein